MQIQTSHVIYAMFACALVINISFWHMTYDLRPRWDNVPPVPTKEAAAMSTLGDTQMAYRTVGLTLQNMGDTGGRTTHVSEYNFDRLGQWFFLEDWLDPNSDFVPLLAAYYFGSSEDPEDIGPVIAYLAKAGENVRGEKWRWLAHAVYLARFELEDMDLALDLAQRLADHPKQERPRWSYEMPAFVMTDKGDKEAAYNLLMGILKDEAENLHPTEVNFIVYYICGRILTKEQADEHPLCST